MKLRPDDEIRRARLVYLGWGRTALPVQWPYGKWALFGLIAAVVSALLFAVFRTPLVLTTALALALVATSKVYDRVDPDRPARRVLRTLATDWRADREPADGDVLPAWDGSQIRLPVRPHVIDGAES